MPAVAPGQQGSASRKYMRSRIRSGRFARCPLRRSVRGRRTSRHAMFARVMHPARTGLRVDDHTLSQNTGDGGFQTAAATVTMLSLIRKTMHLETQTSRLGNLSQPNRQTKQSEMRIDRPSVANSPQLPQKPRTPKSPFDTAKAGAQHRGRRSFRRRLRLASKRCRPRITA